MFAEDQQQCWYWQPVPEQTDLHNENIQFAWQPFMHHIPYETLKLKYIITLLRFSCVILNIKLHVLATV